MNATEVQYDDVVRSDSDPLDTKQSKQCKSQSQNGADERKLSLSNNSFKSAARADVTICSGDAETDGGRQTPFMTSIFVPADKTPE